MNGRRVHPLRSVIKADPARRGDAGAAESGLLVWRLQAAGGGSDRIRCGVPGIAPGQCHRRRRPATTIQGAATHGPTGYGGRFGINYALNSAAPPITKLRREATIGKAGALLRRLLCVALFQGATPLLAPLIFVFRPSGQRSFSSSKLLRRPDRSPELQVAQ